MTKEDVRKKWEARVTAYRSSGEKATKWCKANQVDRRQLYTWMRRIDGAAASISVVPETTWLNVKVAPEAETRSANLNVKLGSAVIEVHPGFNPVLLRDVVQALQALC
ncbi:IS66 family insertion sequence element accessory protein TnpA [Cohnella luojiensis]|uniref:Helix-turn-helix domain-containing protein n=1 Tax=Cohnella luojiensis TaxID=652876 RepID=A0A4Y8LPI8_9BACL|nr:helix-turn-helix domain-containing protein [Cohnella luojiensis]TFE19390.1 helix-turn-helix domain-containing protein [Cohnella luojiensis]